MTILVYLPETNSRTNYIFQLILGQLAGIDPVLTSDLSEFIEHQGPKFAYSPGRVHDGVYIQANDLLFSSEISPREIKMTEVENVPAFFPSGDSGSLLPFDLFSASFYLVTRYEEYLPFLPDRFGRYPAGESIAVKNNFLHLPVINLWTNILVSRLKNQFPGLVFREKFYRMVPTIDIDHAYAYLLRSLYRIAGGYARSLKNLRIFEIIERTAVLLHLTKDPYDNYSMIVRMHQKYHLKPLFFILFAQYGGNDNNVSLRRKKFRDLVSYLDHHGTIGIHPSLASTKKFTRLERELEGLARMTGKEIRKSRQHFLKFTLPKTYRTLISIGVRDDYSMGYASRPGFRAGIADPFPFFDLTTNEKTSLTVHPVAVMDVTLRDYLRLNPAEANEQIRKIISEVRRVNGEFVPLWHNESFSGKGKWKGWREVYESLLEFSEKQKKST